MLKLSALEFFFRTIPESFLIVVIAYLFANKKICKSRFIIASLIIALITYGVRLLPISFGVNTIINMMIFIVIALYIIKIPINVSIFSIFISVILISLCEWLNAILLINVFKIDEFNSSYLKFICNLPSLIMFAIMVYIIYIIRNRICRRFKDVFH
ncbi:hypothetical protein [Clostridium arbusti]|uniref:hypothetical protein n=1 Tax=Clostridium arbusti TaxID=1137848 RepID=UPI000288D429|nr:hypothetical protein [Clostridium arbusti]